jgi:hypothetical protein
LATAPTAVRAQAAPPAAAPTSVGAPRSSAGRALAGALAGGAVGALVGGLAGVYVGGNRCVDAGNPDTCYGIAGLFAGAAAGFTVGTPVGAHLLNRRQGALGPSLLTSAALAAGGVVAFQLADRHARGAARVGTLQAIVVAVPVLQLVSATVIETRTGRR